MNVIPLEHTEAKRRLSILGATGSIGQSTLDIVRSHRADYDIVVLSAHRNAEALIQLALEFSPECVVIGDEKQYVMVKEALAATSIAVKVGMEGLEEAASMPSDITVAAIVGAAGLTATYRAIEHSDTVALANKESLVCAGQLMLEACAAHNTSLLPVDSEHNAIHQVFDFERPESIDHITLTASGGPFLHRAIDTLSDVTPEEAVNHPNWSMGAKISVDSATMMNKALELIEAYHLFPLEIDQLRTIIHPQSVIHSMVHYTDGSVLAQMGHPDMRTPISYCLNWPARTENNAPKLSLEEIGTLEFLKADETRFPALRLAKEVLRAGPSASCAFNAANEIAVDAFLNGHIPFTRIVETVEAMLDHAKIVELRSLNDIMHYNRDIREKTRELLGT